MTNYQGAPLQEQVKKLLEENLAYSKEIYALAQKTKHYIFWGRIMSFISLLFVNSMGLYPAFYLLTHKETKK